MRSINLSQLSADEASLPGFIRHLQAANDAAEVGFLFEEGGCYGMALALHAKLTAMDLDPVIAIHGKGHHAFVLLNGWLIDYTGAQNIEEWSAPLSRMSPKEVMAKALGPWKAEDLLGDVAVADQVIRAAIEMADAVAA